MYDSCKYHASFVRNSVVWFFVVASEHIKHSSKSNLFVVKTYSKRYHKESSLGDRATVEVSQAGVTKLALARMTEHCNLWKWLPDFPNLAVIADRLLSVHTTACASERNWWKWGLMFAKNRARLNSVQPDIELYELYTIRAYIRASQYTPTAHAYCAWIGRCRLQFHHDLTCRRAKLNNFASTI